MDLTVNFKQYLSSAIRFDMISNGDYVPMFDGVCLYVCERITVCRSVLLSNGDYYLCLMDMCVKE